MQTYLGSYQQVNQMQPRPFQRQVRYRPDLLDDICNFCNQRGHHYFNCVAYHRQCVGNLERGLPPPRLNNRINDQNIVQNPPQNLGGMNAPEQQAPMQVITVEEPPLTDVQAVTRHKGKGKAPIQEESVEYVGPSTSWVVNLDIGQMAKITQNVLEQLHQPQGQILLVSW